MPKVKRKFDKQKHSAKAYELEKSGKSGKGGWGNPEDGMDADYERTDPRQLKLATVSPRKIAENTLLSSKKNGGEALEEDVEAAPSPTPQDLAKTEDVAQEARDDKLAAAKLAQDLVVQWEKGIDGTACLWYWGHFWGRVEIWRMTLHFSEINYKSMDFTNDEYDALKPLLTEKGLRELVNGPLPMLHIDGLRITDTLAACRYIGQTRGLYPDSTDAKAVAKIEHLLTGAQSMFQKLVDHHYGNVNKKGGFKVAATDEDMATHGKAVGRSIINFFSMIERDYLTEVGEPGAVYLIEDKLTIADLFTCHYWYIVNQPEFKPLHSPEFAAPIFNAYYASMLGGTVGKYFTARHGSAGAADREATEAVVQKEMRLGHCKGLNYPFRW